MSTSSRTKHVDLRARFITQYVEDGFINIIFVKSEDNESDGFTKNTSGSIYERHTKEYMAKRNYWISG